jgi:hypothetical protein
MIKFIKKLIVLTDFSVFKLFGLFAMIWTTEQILSQIIEVYFYGNPFVHWFDWIFTASLLALLAHACDALANIKVSNTILPPAEVGTENVDEKEKDDE